MIYHLGQRIGNPDQGSIDRVTKERVPTYGLSTLQVKHFKPHGAGYTITFPAKSNVIQTTELQPDDVVRKRLVAYLRRKLQGKGPNDYVWTHGPDQKRISEGSINPYLKEMGWLGGSHKFRHVKGTLLWNKEIAANPPPKSPNAKQMKDYVNDKLLKVGNLLGHKRTIVDKVTGKRTQEDTGNTAAAYVDPNAIAALYKSKNLRVPNDIAKKTSD